MCSEINEYSRDHSKDNSKDKLIEAGRKLFSKVGYDAATVKDIADEARLNISLVSYHFGGKEGLYRACLEEFAKDRFEVARRILTEPQTLDEVRIRLEMYATEIMHAHTDQPDLCKIIMRDLDMNNKIALEIFKETFLKSANLTIEFFKSAQTKNILRKDIQPVELTGIFMGSVLHHAQRDEMIKRFFKVSIKDAHVRESIVKSIVSVMLSGAKS